MLLRGGIDTSIELVGELDEMLRVFVLFERTKMKDNMNWLKEFQYQPKFHFSSYKED